MIWNLIACVTPSILAQLLDPADHAACCRRKIAETTLRLPNIHDVREGLRVVHSLNCAHLFSLY